MDDIAGLGKAAEKLLDVIRAGAGALYKPRAIRKDGEAEAYKAKLLGDAEAEAEAKRIIAISQAEAMSKKILADADIEIIERMQTRLVQKELNRQKNIEAISDAAFKELPENVSEEAVDKDWLNRFFNIAEDISDEMMQDVWGRLLAGEVTKPGRFSMRSLETLRNMSHADAVYFNEACSLAFNNNYLIDREGLLNKFGLDFQKISALQAANLIYENPTNFGRKNNELKFKLSYHDISCVFIQEKQGDEHTFMRLPLYQVFRFTPAGNELSKLVKTRAVYQFLRDLSTELKKDDIEFKRIEEVNGQQIITEF